MFTNWRRFVRLHERILGRHPKSKQTKEVLYIYGLDDDDSAQNIRGNVWNNDYRQIRNPVHGSDDDLTFVINHRWKTWTRTKCLGSN